MSEMMEQARAEAVPVEAAPAGVVDEGLAARLVDQAREEGLTLTGPDGLLGKLTSRGWCWRTPWRVRSPGTWGMSFMSGPAAGRAMLGTVPV